MELVLMERLFTAHHPAACIPRRRAVKVGGLAALGLTLPQLLKAETVARVGATGEVASSGQSPRVIDAKAKSCILFFMEGAPSHIDLWDMKPDAPEQIRGQYSPIATSLPGFHVCEHLPLWAPLMHHMAVVRSMSHPFVDHNASSYYALTGQIPLRESQLIRGPSPDNAPPFGSVLAKMRPSGEALPDYVHVPKLMFNCGDFIPGALAGLLGDAYDPLIAGDPSASDFNVPGLERVLTDDRFDRRRALLGRLDDPFATTRENAAIGRMETFYERAYSLITSPKAREAFDLGKEPAEVRERYGLPKPVGGYRGNGLPHLGQSFLLARRLVEAGVRLVTIWAGNQAFDTHTNHFASVTNALCPPINQAFSALLADLADRGLLAETLVVVVGEFGRTPKMGQITSSAGATPDGRDHWPHCYTAFLAGGGAKAGMVYGSSDAMAAYPAENPVTPGDFAATVYTLLGIDPQTRIYDRFRRPHSLVAGEPIVDLIS